MKALVCSAIIFCSLLCGYTQNNQPLRVFIRAGVKTHGPGEHDHPRFLEQWTQLLRERGAAVQGALRFPTAAELEQTDVVIFYCAEGGSIAGPDRTNFEGYLGRGGGVVMIHDAICGTNAHWLKTVVGGAWEHGRARWQEGLMGLYFGDYQHPITEGVSNFDLDDEIYYQLHLMPGAQVIASSFHTAKEIVPQMWVYETNHHRAFVSIPGHRTATFELPHYRGLLLRGIAWAGRRDVDSLLQTEERESFRYPVGGPTAPEKAAEKIEIDPEFELNLVAAEPLVVKPISVDWDARGRMWVAVTPEYPFKVGDQPGRDSILILDDSDGDGRMDKRHVFASGLTLVTSFVFHRDGLIVAQAPQILFLRDADGDGVAETREVLFDGFGTYDTHAVISNLRWGLDGWVYATQGYSGNQSERIVNRAGQTFGKIGNGIFRFRPDGSAVEMVASYGGNSWGLDFRWDGELFFSKANGPHISHVVLPERYFLRGRVTGASSDKAIEDHQKVYPLYGDQRHEYVQVAPVGLFTAASGAMLYEGAAWPEKYHSSYFVCEPTVHIVHEDVILSVEGSPTFEASKRAEKEFLAGRDLWFRPVHTRFGPDGAMYILDFYNQAISHNDIRGIAHGPGNAAVRPDRDHQHGRIWRVQHRHARVFERLDLNAADGAALVQALEHPNGWVRWTAQRLLVERNPPGAADDLVTLYQTSRQAHARVHALWTLSHLAELPEDTLVAAIADPHWNVQKNALQIVAAASNPLASSAERQVVRQLSSDSERVRLLALLALGRGTPGSETVRSVLRRWPDLKESWTRNAILYVAAQDPVRFLKGSFDSDRADSYTELARKLVERAVADGDAVAAREIVIEAADHSERKDKLKIAVLEALRPALDQFQPSANDKFAEALLELLRSKNRLLRVAALPLASRYPDLADVRAETATVTDSFLKELESPELKDEERMEFLGSLASLPTLRDQVFAALERILAGSASGKLQRLVINQLGTMSEPSAGRLLIDHFRSFTAENRPLAFSTIARRRPWTQDLLAALREEKIRVTEIGLEAVNRLRNHPDAAVAKEAGAVFAALEGASARQKDALLAEFQVALQEPGDVKNGEKLFEQNCAVCHRLGGKGPDLGPDLTGVGWNGANVLLVHILDPNRVVEGNYMPYHVRTKKDEEFYGLVARENRESVVLRGLTGETEVRRDDIASMKSSGVSLMPEGFEALGQSALRDIITYLVQTSSKNFRALDLSAAFTADSRRGLYAEHTEHSQLAFKRFGLVNVESIPFLVADPSRHPSGHNLIVLKGGTGFADTLPRRVEVPVGSKAAKLYILGGVAGWGYPYGELDGHYVPAAKITLHYTDGEKEEIVLRNGEEIADYVAQIEVPGSRYVPGLVEHGQIRWLSLTPRRDVAIKSLTLESYDNHLAPTFAAMTIQVEAEN